MIQVLLEVRTGAARFRVSARARSIRRAINLAGAGYPGGEVRLVLPIEPESFFAEDGPDEMERVAVQMPESMVG